MSDSGQDVSAFFEAIDNEEGEALVAKLNGMLEANPELAQTKDSRGISPIRQALYQRKDEAKDLLLGKGITLDGFDAAALGDVDRLKECLSEDSGLVKAAAGDGFQLLQLAAYFNRPEAVDLLLEAGADPNAVAENGAKLQALHSAAAAQAAPIARKLLKAGADVNAQQAGGWTALHAASKQGNMEMVLLLLEHEADMELKADDGRTAGDIAEDEGQDDVKLLLFRYS